MKWRAAAAVGFLLAAPAARGLIEPELPSWPEEDRKAWTESGWIAGADLLSDEPIPEDPQSATAGPLELDPPKPEEIAEDAKLSPEIPEQYLADYFAERPKQFLVDPQRLLAEADFRDRLRFLDYHAGDSTIDVFVYVMGGEQEIPSEVREEEIIERFFAEGRPAAVIYYYLGAPQRSVVYLSPSITDSVSAAEQHRALESSIIQAFERTEPAGQLEKFLVQMSIRIYWMERMLGGEPSLGETLPLLRAASDRESAAKNSDKFSWLRQIALRFAVPVSVVIGSLLTAFGMSHWLRLRARYRFPEFEVEPRLGGAHAAGVGAVISFASAAVPPASQRDQVPDYLRRA